MNGEPNDDPDAIDLDAVCRALSHPAVVPQLLRALTSASPRDVELDGLETIGEIAGRLVGRPRETP